MEFLCFGALFVVGAAGALWLIQVIARSVAAPPPSPEVMELREWRAWFVRREGREPTLREVEERAATLIIGVGNDDWTAASRPETPQACGRCGLTNPPTSTRCDCGYLLT